ncbi:UNVERIFIED_CONTAM: Retrovirus-related Pol polyprotein from transposon TNT 1-94 [Sesamum calycinum]|uniref:Retrovirus-related Pol polyprotein from transposon TNT 1-94 n=1 Tax=Sesamum calycinum TaxID=2727403 RepID=A0AAW2RAF2_9LAMI
MKEHLKNAVFLEKDFPLDTRHEELLLEESSEATSHSATTSSSLPVVPNENISILQGSIKCLEVTRFEMVSMSPNKVWTLVDPPKSFKPIGCKWVYKRKRGAVGEVTTFKSRLEIYMDQSVNFISIGEEQKELVLEGYSDASFQSDIEKFKSQSDFFFKLNSGGVAWKSSKQDTTANSITKFEYIEASKAAKETVWMKNYIQELGVVLSIVEPIIIFWDNNGAIAQVKEPRSHHKSKLILRCYHLLQEMVDRGDVRVFRATSVENTRDPLNKPISQIAHTQHR